MGSHSADGGQSELAVTDIDVSLAIRMNTQPYLSFSSVLVRALLAYSVSAHPGLQIEVFHGE